MRSRQTLPAGIVLDRGAAASLRDQLVTELARTIDSRLLPCGTRMPSTRTLAETLGVSRSVAVAAYELLLARGYLEIRPASGTYVARPSQVPAAAPTRRLPPSAPDAPPPVDLRPGRVPRDGFPLAAWRAAWRHAGHRPRTDWLPDLGLPGLRRELRRHIETSRWQSLAGYETAAVADLGRAVRVLLGALDPAGRVGIAELAPAALHRAVAASGWPVVAVPVDDQGLVPAEIPLDAGAVVVPDAAYQPAGRAAPVARQRALAAWSARTGGYLIEASLNGAASATAAPSLLSLAPPARGSAVGSFTALLGTELPVAYVVIPQAHADPLRRLVVAHDAQPPAIAQDVLRRLLADGVVDRRVAALRRQREAAAAPVLRAFAHVAGAVVTGPSLDGAITVWLPPGRDAPAIAAAARERGVLTSTIAESAPFGTTGNGIVVDVGHVDEVSARRALRTLSALCTGATSRSGFATTG